MENINPNKLYKQVIIARKDLNMSTGKLAAQVSHASMAFLTNAIKQSAHEVLDCEIGYAWEGSFHGAPKPALYRHPDLNRWAEEARAEGKDFFYYERVSVSAGILRRCERKSHIESVLKLDQGVYDGWINGIFTKVVLQARNKSQLLKVIDLAKEAGLVEGRDYFCIRDNCLTELVPEEVDENGVGRTLTCIGFRPMESEIIDKIGRKYHIWTD